MEQRADVTRPEPLAVFARQAGPLAGEALPVEKPIINIGQGRHNELVIEDDSVSSNHATLAYEQGQWRLTDAGSTNGTYVDDARLAPGVATPLNDGSLVRFGGVRLQFNTIESADPDAARAAYSAPAPARGRRRLRIPVWLAALILLVLIAAIMFLVLGRTPEPQTAPDPVPAPTTTSFNILPAPVSG